MDEKVNNFIKFSKYSNNITIFKENKLLGTAGTLINNANFFEGQDGLLIHADNYCVDDLTNLIKAHANRSCSTLMTMLTFRCDNPTSCGIVETSDENIVVAFHEKVNNPPSNLANGAIYVLSKELITILSRESYIDFSTQVIPNLLGKIKNYETDEYFIDIGTLENYKQANKYAKR